MHVTESFLTYLQFERRYSNHTVSAYCNDLEQFSDFLNSHFDHLKPEHASHHQIRSWIVALIETKVSTRSIRRKLASLSSYYKHLIRNKVITSNPVQKVISPKINVQLPSFIRNSEMEDLLVRHDFGNDFEGLRNKLIIELLYTTGIRRSELLNLKVSEIDMTKTIIKVIGKGNKHRIVPLAQHTKPLIVDYLLERQCALNEINEQSPYLFITSKGKQTYPGLIYRTVTKHLNYVSTNSKKNPHILRHSFATSLLNNGADINVIKEILGHANLQATQVYTHNTSENLKSIYKQAHPRAK
ncbi:MAG: tyrosine-type recombinase/integrase [Bacteroidales bacterium]|nr:tyrosine-type recombinase/integrase [Bacteroidales bacterium]